MQAGTCHRAKFVPSYSHESTSVTGRDTTGRRRWSGTETLCMRFLFLLMERINQPHSIVWQRAFCAFLATLKVAAGYYCNSHASFFVLVFVVGANIIITAIAASKAEAKATRMRYQHGR